MTKTTKISRKEDKDDEELPKDTVAYPNPDLTPNPDPLTPCPYCNIADKNMHALVANRRPSHCCPMYVYRKMAHIERRACIIANRLPHSFPMHAYRKMSPIERRVCIIANRLPPSAIASRCMRAYRKMATIE